MTSARIYLGPCICDSIIFFALEVEWLFYYHLKSNLRLDDRCVSILYLSHSIIVDVSYSCPSGCRNTKQLFWFGRLSTMEQTSNEGSPWYPNLDYAKMKSNRMQKNIRIIASQFEIQR